MYCDLLIKLSFLYALQELIIAKCMERNENFAFVTVK